MNRHAFADLTARQQITMLVVASIHQAIELASTDERSSTQTMKLEILIRQAVFDALVAIDQETPLRPVLDDMRSQSSEDDAPAAENDEIAALVASIPEYWEIPNAGYRLDEN